MKNKDLRDLACSRITQVEVYLKLPNAWQIKPSSTITLVKIAIGKGPIKRGTTENLTLIEGSIAA